MSVVDQKDGAPASPGRRWWWLALVGIGVWAAALLPSVCGAGLHELPYSEFKQDLASGKVQELTVSPKQVLGKLKQTPSGWRSSEFSTVRVEDPQLTTEALAAGAKVTGVQP